MLSRFHTPRLIINKCLKKQVYSFSTRVVPPVLPLSARQPTPTRVVPPVLPLSALQPTPTPTCVVPPVLPVSARQPTPSFSHVSRTVSTMALDEKLKAFRSTSLRKAGVDADDQCLVDPSILWPPESVRGMQTLDVEAFNKSVVVPVARVSVTCIGPVLFILKNYYLKLRSFSALADDENGDGKVVYLNPLSFEAHEEKIRSQIDDVCKKHNVESSEVVKFGSCSLELKYENWNANSILRAVLPLEDDGVKGFSKIGHIIHLNLKEHLDPYKKLIGQVLLDKAVDNTTMVVNKVDTIDNSDNTFRSFSMEVLAGEGETVATLKQNRCDFTFDFAKVYWNTRLSTEHETIVQMLERGDVLYDVMAGVGPFSVPAAKQQKCSVLANDLNPESYRWLQHNCKANCVSDEVSCHNLDGNQFIKTVLKEDLLKRWRDAHFEGQIHVTMNLPSIAVEFLPSFVGLMSDISESEDDTLTVVEPIVHVYMFSKDQRSSSCVTRVAYYLGLVDTLPDFDGEVVAAIQAKHALAGECAAQAKHQGATADSGPHAAAVASIKQLNKKKLVQDSVDIPGLVVKEVSLVRKVAPLKVMVRVSFCLTKNLMFSRENKFNTMAENKLTLDTGSNGQQCTDSSDQASQKACKRIKLDDSTV